MENGVVGGRRGNGRNAVGWKGQEGEGRAVGSHSSLSTDHVGLAIVRGNANPSPRRTGARPPPPTPSQLHRPLHGVWGARDGLALPARGAGGGQGVCV